MKNHYKIGEVANILGVSADTIRYYEKMGIVFSHKDETNGYRYFTASDIYALLDVLFYRNLDIPVEEVRDIMNSYRYKDVKALLLEKEKQLERKIEMQKRLLLRIRTTIEDYEVLDESLGVFSVREMPAHVIFNETQADSQVYFSNAMEKTSFQQSGLTLTDQGFFAAPRKNVWEMTRLFTVLDRQQVTPQNIPQNSRTISFSKAAYTVVRFGWGDPLDDVISPLASWAENEGYRADGDVAGFWIFTDYSQNPPVDYAKLYLPVQKLH